ncbi:MAG: molecular chaperone DnaJ, partial [Prevotella sp.]|nr:molecular chaperone DnaJ [Prevotella sp.]
YDQFGHDAPGGFGGFGGFSDPFDIFSSFGGFGGFGFSGQRGPRTNRGSDLRVKVKLSLKDIASGVEKKIKVNKFVACSRCRGTGADGGAAYETCSTCKGTGVVTRVMNTILGQMQTQTTCPACNGEGRAITKKCPHCAGEGILREEEVITINIPAGVAEGMQLSMSGKGNAARHGGINGDLLIVVEEERHPELFRDDNDVVYNLLLSVSTAALGGNVVVPTIDGKVKVTIDPGTQPGKVLRLKNKGLPSVNRYGTGDLLVNISVYIPENLSDSEKTTLTGLENSPNFQPSKSVKEKIFNHFRKMFD